MEYLLGLIAVLLGGFIYQKKRADVASARNDNLDVKESLNTIDKDRAKNSGLLEAEEAKRSTLDEELKDVKTSNATLDALLDYFKRK